jgi:hypothetical protein
LTALLLVGGIVGSVAAVGPGGAGGGGGGETKLLAGGDTGGTSDEDGPRKRAGGGEDGDDKPQPATVQARGEDAGQDDDDDDTTVVARSGDEVRDNRAPEPPPATSIEEGPPVDGFPVPKDVKLLASTPQAEVFETGIGPRDAIAFYKSKLSGRYRVGDVPNGIMIEGPDTPFSYVTFTPYADRFNMVLTRNALAAQPDKPAGPPPPAFGVGFPDDATLVMKSEQAVAMRSRKPFDEVCAFYEKQFGGIKGVMVMRDDDTPSCTIAASMAQGTAWLAVAVVKDPMSTGALLISVVPRQ